MRLGDYVDDYCSRCKRTTDHAVVSMAADEVQKVRCRTCSYEHKYRRNQTGKKRADQGRSLPEGAGQRHRSVGRLGSRADEKEALEIEAASYFRATPPRTPRWFYLAGPCRSLQLLE